MTSYWIKGLKWAPNPKADVLIRTEVPTKAQEEDPGDKWRQEEDPGGDSRGATTNSRTPEITSHHLTPGERGHRLCS
jgi:hypothetical protein